MISYRYRIVIAILFILLTFSISMPLMNYFVAYKTTKKQLQERSLPLTIDNIYTEIQKQIIEPNLVSSMMAHDTFLQDWLINKEEDVTKISKYLETIKNKYSMFSTFLVSEKTKNYYTQAGLVEKIEKDKEQNAWYFSFQKKQCSHEINLDYNDYIDDSMIMFINHKIFDEKYHMIGATGVGLKISYINDMLKKFRQRYHFKVFFLNNIGDVVLYERGANAFDSLENIPELYALKDTLISKESKVIEYTVADEKFLINTKYIEDLDLYLVVEAKTSEFMQEIKSTLYTNLGISLLLSIIIGGFILAIIRRYHKKLEFLANHDTLTGLNNRRTFNENFESFFHLSKRQNSSLALLFLDIDDFKKINDTYGHFVGDKVLKQIAKILSENIRQSDILARWGGEEFIIAFFDIGYEESRNIAEKLRKAVQEDSVLGEIVNSKVTASFGLTFLTDSDTQESVFQRLDSALYEAKESGKNQIVVK